MIGEGHRPGRRWARLGVGLAALACGAASGGPSLNAVALRRQLRASGFSPVQTQAALAALEDANAHELPASALENRLREGLARHAEPTAILRVLADRRALLARADDLVHSGAREGIAVRDRESALTRLADSFSMGVRQADVVSVLPAAAMAHRDLGSVSHAAEVMGRLVRQGVQTAETRDVLRAALVAGWTRNQMDGLVDVYVEARRLDVPPDRTRQALAEGIRDGKDLTRLTEDMSARAKTHAASHAASPSHAAGAPKGAKGSSSSHGPGARSAAPHTPHGPRAAMPRPPMPHH